jgi:hypothetical protein
LLWEFALILCGDHVRDIARVKENEEFVAGLWRPVVRQDGENRGVVVFVNH